MRACDRLRAVTDYTYTRSYRKYIREELDDGRKFIVRGPAGPFRYLAEPSTLPMR